MNSHRPYKVENKQLPDPSDALSASAVCSAGIAHIGKWLLTLLIPDILRIALRNITWRWGPAKGTGLLQVSCGNQDTPSCEAGATHT
jgi:hypothetical protein